MATTFGAYNYVGPMRHLDSMSLLSLRDALRNEDLSVQKPRLMADGETTLVSLGSTKLVAVIDLDRIKDGVYPKKTSVEDAMDHHLAANIILRERGFTEAIDSNPELTIDLP